jgi:hypothetical protein
MAANNHALGYTGSISNNLADDLADSRAYQETMAIMQHVDHFSTILLSMREAREGKILSLASAFSDLI